MVKAVGSSAVIALYSNVIRS